MKVQIEIQSDSAAFDQDSNGEVARILQRIATSFQNGQGSDQMLWDINGNICGSVLVWK